MNTTNYLKPLTDSFFPLNLGEIKFYGYIDSIAQFTVNHQLLDEDTWKIFVEQFRLRSDFDNCWRGEYFGKMMRGGAMTYQYTKNEKLYRVLKNAVLDLLSTQDEFGRITTYPLEKEFNGWDMWVRKYVLLGCLYFYDICKSKTVKKRLIDALSIHADYIIEHVGESENKKPILETSAVWGGLNSASVLEPFVKLYIVTGEEKYLDFAKYIAQTGFCKGMNLIDVCLKKELLPYQFRFTKAYEMMNCFEGLLELYRLTKEKDYLSAAVNFADMVDETDITIIGSAGCTHELFDNSAVKQTEFSEEVMQETCVTVTWMKLNYQLLLLTGESKYADRIEKSALNALHGAVNNEFQDMHRAKAMVYTNGEPSAVDHEPYPFDSYSPLFNNRRGLKVGGFKKMQKGRSYGCCACIGSAGTALTEIFGVLKSKEGLVFNLYEKSLVKTEINGIKIRTNLYANLYKSRAIRLKIRSNGKFTVALRIPKWTKKFQVKIDGQNAVGNIERGYFIIDREWTDNVVDIRVDDKIKIHRLNGKVAFTKGPYVLAKDLRFGDLKESINVGKAMNTVGINRKNSAFNTNLTLDVKTLDGNLTLCDYAQAGKNYDDETSGLTVWLNSIGTNNS